MTSMTETTPEVETTSPVNAAKVAGLRALADFIEQHPELPNIYTSARISVYAAELYTIEDTVKALAPCAHGDDKISRGRYEFRRTFAEGVDLVLDVATAGLFTEVTRETVVYELPAELRNLADGTVKP